MVITWPVSKVVWCPGKVVENAISIKVSIVDGVLHDRLQHELDRLVVPPEEEGRSWEDHINLGKRIKGWSHFHTLVV